MTDPRGQNGTAVAPRRPGTVAPVALHLVGGLLAMLGPFFGWVVVVAVLPSLITFLVARKNAELRAAARAALNFQITWVGLMLIFVVGGPVIGQIILSNGHYFDVFVALLVPAFIALVIALFDLIVSAIAGFGASRDRNIRYPLSLHLIR